MNWLLVLRGFLILGALAALLLIAIACRTEPNPITDRLDAVEQRVVEVREELAAREADAGSANVAPGNKHFFLTGVEWKGTTSADKLPPPSVDPTSLSNGYGFNAPGFDASNPQNWRVAAYVFTPGAMMAYQGDTVDLTTFIVNGDIHSVRLAAPDGTQVGETAVMNRGREYNFSFKASQSGVYRLVCDTHSPNMSAKILVLPPS